MRNCSKTDALNWCLSNGYAIDAKCFTMIGQSLGDANFNPNVCALEDGPFDLTLLWHAMVDRWNFWPLSIQIAFNVALCFAAGALALNFVCMFIFCRMAKQDRTVGDELSLVAMDVVSIILNVFYAIHEILLYVRQYALFCPYRSWQRLAMVVETSGSGVALSAILLIGSITFHRHLELTRKSVFEGPRKDRMRLFRWLACIIVAFSLSYVLNGVSLNTDYDQASRPHSVFCYSLATTEEEFRRALTNGWGNRFCQPENSHNAWVFSLIYAVCFAVQTLLVILYVVRVRRKLRKVSMVEFLEEDSADNLGQSIVKQSLIVVILFEYCVSVFQCAGFLLLFFEGRVPKDIRPLFQTLPFVAFIFEVSFNAVLFYASDASFRAEAKRLFWRK